MELTTHSFIILVLSSSNGDIMLLVRKLSHPHSHGPNLLKWFVPENNRECKRAELECLQQEDMLVTKYYVKFYALVRHASV